jgi:DNA mismatch repair protein MutL
MDFSSRVNEASHTAPIIFTPPQENIPTYHPVSPEVPREVSESFQSPYNANSHHQGDKRFPVIEAIGQLHGTYILAQNEDGLYMIDQHAAQERIKYEFYVKQLSNPNPDVQLFLEPLVFERSHADISILQESIHQIRALGIEIEFFGGTTILIRSYPAWFPKGEEEGYLEDVFYQIIQDRKIDIGKVREKLAIQYSCKRSIKANHFLSIQEMNQLLHHLSTCEQPFTCPHGRPILLLTTNREIESRVKRT